MYIQYIYIYNIIILYNYKKKTSENPEVSATRSGSVSGQKETDITFCHDVPNTVPACLAAGSPKRLRRCEDGAFPSPGTTLW